MQTALRSRPLSAAAVARLASTAAAGRSLAGRKPLVAAPRVAATALPSSLVAPASQRFFATASSKAQEKQQTTSSNASEQAASSAGGGSQAMQQQHQQQSPQQHHAQGEHAPFFEDFDRLHDTINALMGDFAGVRRGRRGRRSGRRGQGFDPLGMFEDELFADFPHNPLLGAGGGQHPGLNLLAGGRGPQSAGMLTPHQDHPAGQLSNAFGLQVPTLRCRVNVEDQKDKLVVTAEVPGFDKSNLKIHIDEDDVLTISGEQKAEHVDEAKDKKFLRVERSFGQVQRSLKLPRHVDRSKIAARYENGILHIDLPKGEEQAKQTSINIQ